MSNTKSNEQSKNLVCGSCGIDINKHKDYISLKSHDKPTLYRCILCAKVHIKRDETYLLNSIGGHLDEVQEQYDALTVDLEKKEIMELVKTNNKHRFVKYFKAYLKKLIDMIKTDLQTLNQYKYKMSRQYLMEISSKLIDEAQILSKQDDMCEQTYLLLCEKLQKFLNKFDNIFQTKLFLVKNY